MSLTSADAVRLERCLVGDRIAVIPTDTVYGLACNPASRPAVERIYELKRRPPRKPSAVMFFALEPALQALTDLGPRTREAIVALLPGPLTLLLPDPSRRYPLAEGSSDGDGDGDGDGGDDGGGGGGDGSGGGGAGGTGDTPLFGLRVPVFSGASAALSAVRLPALQSSANFSGDPDPRSLCDVPAALRAGADLVLDGGDLPGKASTVLDLGAYEHAGEWRIVREGPLGANEIERMLG